LGYIGRTPTGSILTGADIADGSISTAKLADTAVSTAKIADDAVGNTKLNLASDYAFTGTVTGAGGIAMVDQWRLNANKTANAVFSSDLERVDTDGFGQLGTGMTESSGNFTFPSTGIYSINMIVSSDNQTTTGIYTTINNSSYGKAVEIYTDSSIQSGTGAFIFDVTNTSTHKVQFQKTGGGGTVYGTTNDNATHFTFIRLGDT